MMPTVRQSAPAKVNLVLRIGPFDEQRGLHRVASLFASLDLADEVELEPAHEDIVECDGVEGPNLVEHALRMIRGYAPWIPPMRARITKRIPVAAGLAGGSADAAAALRAANSFQEIPFDDDQLRTMAAPLGSDVPSQVVPAHSVVTGTGELVQRVQLPELALVLVTAEDGLSTRDVFEKARSMGLAREQLESDDLRELAAQAPAAIAARLENDLQPATLALRPELQDTIERLRELGALNAQVSGSGPTVFGVFAEREAAEHAAAQVPRSLVTMVASR